jgi:segregation and condensation protein B
MTLDLPSRHAASRSKLGYFGFDSLRDLPDIERLEDAELLGRAAVLGDLGPPSPIEGDDDEG